MDQSTLSTAVNQEKIPKPSSVHAIPSCGLETNHDMEFKGKEGGRKMAELECVAPLRPPAALVLFLVAELDDSLPVDSDHTTGTKQGVLSETACPGQQRHLTEYSSFGCYGFRCLML
ncbi:hypothetical protein PAL_GLEAN10016699 [Pteropus alecto]|uniref:Uncharacterized protein n=1 Tax=Pteropus alecto TaxID=9402 RepID=L5JXJ7_PTEAL|nr:hypothetical protein PAL_GLEAN10016699 [Pteropus alecto]